MNNDSAVLGGPGHDPPMLALRFFLVILLATRKENLPSCRLRPKRLHHHLQAMGNNHDERLVVDAIAQLYVKK